MFPAFKLIADLNERFGETFEKRGVRPKFSLEEGEPEITFESASKDRFIPMTISFEDYDKTRGLAGVKWQHAVCVIDHYKEWFLGENKWRYLDPRGSSEKVLADGATKREIFSFIGQQLKKLPIVPWCGEMEGYVTDQSFAKAYEKVCLAVSRLGKKPKVICETVNGENCYKFEDALGNPYRIAFGTSVTVYAGDAVLATSVRGDHNDFFDDVFKEIKALQETATSERTL